jgi:hypothetical protein
MLRGFSIIILMVFSGCASTNFGGGIGIGGHGGSGVHVGGGVGVSTPVVGKKGGPPDHAPAHGYRKKHEHDNVEMIYDGELHAYAVIDFANHYFHENMYFRLVGEYWEVAAVFNGPWTRAEERRIPATLRHKHRNHGTPPGLAKNKGKGKGKGKNK